jgi:hypothetical protein
MDGAADLEIAQILASAASLLATAGWVRGVLHDPGSGSYDLLGAVAIASGCARSCLYEAEFPLLTAPIARRAYALGAWELLDGELGMDPLDWNDRPERRGAEVVGLLRRLEDVCYFRALATLPLHDPRRRPDATKGPDRSPTPSSGSRRDVVLGD